MSEHNEIIRTTTDVAAGSIAVGAVVQWLPPIAAALTVIWLCIRLYEYVRWVHRGRIGTSGPN